MRNILKLKRGDFMRVIFEDEIGDLWILKDVDVDRDENIKTAKIASVNFEGYVNGYEQIVTEEYFKKMTIFRLI